MRKETRNASNEYVGELNRGNWERDVSMEGTAKHQINGSKEGRYRRWNGLNRGDKVKCRNRGENVNQVDKGLKNVYGSLLFCNQTRWFE